MRIALLLGGPSLKSVDVGAIKADFVVGVNWGFLFSQVQMNVVCDYRLMDRIRSDHVLADGTLAIDRYTEWCSHEEYNDFIFVDHARQKIHYPRATTVKSTYPEWPRYPKLITDGLYCRNNVGLSGLSAACLLIPSKGTIEIYGLDLDVNTKSGKTENFHNEHDPKWSADADVAYPGMIKEWAAAAKLIPPGIRVVNKNRNSAYRGFDFE